MASFVGKSLRRPATGDKVSNGDSAKWRNMQLIKKQKEQFDTMAILQWRSTTGNDDNWSRRSERDEDKR
jgi:hypothetical protein